MKKKYSKFLYVLLIFAMMLCVSPFSADTAFARGANVSDTDIDINLYNKLCAVKGSSRVLYSNDFNSEKFATITMHGADTVNKDSNLVDITGLEKFRFDYTTTLDLSNNSIMEISATTLSAFPNLQVLIVSNNQLTSLDVSGCYKLKQVIANNNNLSNFNAGDMNATDCVINLSANKLDSFSDITLPYQADEVIATLNLYANNITDFDSTPAGYQVNLGLQGISNKKNIEKKDIVKYYPTAEDLDVKYVIKSGSNVIRSFVNSDISQVENIDLPYGDYAIEYYYINDLSEEKIISTKTDKAGGDYYQKFFDYFKYSEFSILPSSPDYVYIIDGKEYSDVNRITKKCQITLSGDEGTKLYYKISSGDWVEGSTINITRGGTYTIYVKSVSEDGAHESFEKAILIKASSNLTFPSILIILFIVLIGVGIFAVAYPFIKKYIL